MTDAPAVVSSPRRSPARRIARALLASLALLAAIVIGALLWYRFRPLPAPVTRPLFKGVTYTRAIRRGPSPLVVHTVRVDLGAPGLRFLVTPGDPSRREPLAARTTSDFLREFGLQIAINGDFFSPWHSNGPLDYYPHRGDPVTVDGHASSNGVTYAQGEAGTSEMTLRISRDQRPSFSLPLDEAYNTISGRTLLRDGQIRVLPHGDHLLQPRSAIALDREEKTLFLVVVDGRQPRYSVGADIVEISNLVRDLGVYNAMMLDGGGSSTLVAEGSPGKAEVLSKPVHGRIPGWERPVANHLGIHAERL
jgi:hypothetical protein